MSRDGPRPSVPPGFLEELRARTPLGELIGRRVPLRRMGRNWSGCCPFHGERNPSFHVYPDHFHCFGCGAHGDAIDYVMRSAGMNFLDATRALAAEAGMALPGDTASPRALPQAQTAAPAPPPRDDARDQAETAEKRAYAHRLWLEARPSIAGTPVESYLIGRQIDLRRLGRAPRALRFHPALRHPYARIDLPAMVSAISGEGGVHLATHCTFLERVAGGWIKARVNPAKVVRGSYTGGSIRLWRGASKKALTQAAPTEPVFIGEGIETCLSVAVAAPELRILSAGFMGNLGAVWLPPQVSVVVLLADNDVKLAARAAFQREVNRLLERGLDVRVARPDGCKDFNDMLRGDA